MKTKTKIQGRKLYARCDELFQMCYASKNRKGRSGRSTVKQWYRDYLKRSTRRVNHACRFQTKMDILRELNGED